MFTRQETFDIAVTGVLGQGGQSIHEEGHCVYRNEKGRKCAAGHLIPDDRYDESLEYASVCEIAIDRCSETGIFSYTVGRLTRVGDIIRDEGHDLDLVCYLQSAHDNLVQRASIDALKINFLEVAADFDLDPSIINQF